MGRISFAVILTAVVLAAGVQSAAAQTWNCGPGGSAAVTAAFSGGTLTVSGTGAMSDYTSATIPWLSHISSITNVIIENGVTSIGNQAFINSNNLTSITIANSVTSIGGWAFQGSGLISVTIPGSVITVGNFAFSRCASLVSINVDPSNPNYSSEDGVFFNKNKTTIIQYPSNKQGAYVIPNSVTSFGSAFSGATGITSVAIGTGVTSIETQAFDGCTGLASVAIGTSVTSIAMAAFQNNALISITIPDNVTSIGDMVFSGNTRLASVTIGTGVATIGSAAFQNCTGLNHIISLRAAPPTIAANTFFGVSKAIPLYVMPSSVTAYRGAAGWSDFSNAEPVLQTWYCGAAANPGGVESVIAVLTVGGTLRISGTGAMADYNNTSAPWYTSRELITNVIIENGVTSIGNSAFYGGLFTSITIPNSVTSIGSSVFRTAGITSITIPGSVTEIGSMSFLECSDLISIDVALDNAVFSSDNGVLFNKDKTTIVQYPGGRQGAYTIPGGVTSIGASAFGYNEALTSVTIPDGVTSIGSNAFRNTGLTSVTIPYGVTSILGFTFDGCASLASVTIPGSVTSIAGSAFQSSGLVSLNIPASVTTIADAAFNNCRNLTFIEAAADNPNYSSEDGILFNKDKTTLVLYPAAKEGTQYAVPSSVTSIANRAFSGCARLTSITIHSSVTSIGSDAFRGCTGLTSINIPNSVTTIGNYAFSGCTGLTSINIPNSVTSIGQQVFQSCTGLISVTIPESVTSIGILAFTGCTNLTTVIILRETPPTFGSNAFSNVDINNICLFVPQDGIGAYEAASGWRDFGSIKSISQMRTVTFDLQGGGAVLPQILSVGDKVEKPADPVRTGLIFGGWYRDAEFIEAWDFNADVVTDDITLYAKFGWNCGTAPGTVIAVLVNGTLRISGTGAMQNWSSDSWPWHSSRSLITNVVIENGVTNIGSNAFMNCVNLTSITIPNSVASIGNGAFSGSTGLTSITIPNSVTTIANNTFDGCTALASINAETGNINYSSEDGVLFNQNRTTLIRYPQGKQGAYTIPGSVTSIGARAFLQCNGLTAVTIPGSVISIGNDAFVWCTGLTSVTIGGGVTSIGSSAFNGCTGLTSVSIPGSVETIGSNAFRWCENLTSIEIASDNPNYTSEDGVLFDKDKTTLIQYPGGKQGAYAIPGSVTAIEQSAFAGSRGLTDVTIPGSVTEIAGSTFYMAAALTSIIIPNSVTEIGSEAFSGCTNLTSVTIGSGVTFIGDMVFYDCNNLTVIISLNPVPPETEGDGIFFVEEFDGPNPAACLYVLQSSIGAYEPAHTWRLFSCIKSVLEAGYPTVTFNSNGGSAVDPLLLVSGDKITKPADPALTDYAFAGWYKDAAFTNAWDFAVDVITDDITLYAKWAGSITAAAITVTAPQTGIAPNTAAAGSGNFSVGTVTWTPVTPTGLFLGGTQYTAAVTLTATGNYAFTGITTGSNLTINGNNAVIVENTYTALTISYQFSATDAKTVDGISIKNQPAKLTYTHGDVFDMTGLLVTLAYNDGTTADAAFANFAANTPVITTSVANGITLTRASHDNMSVAVLCNGYSVNTDNITVNKAAQTALIITPPETKTYGDDNFQLTFTGGTTGNAVVYTVVGGSGSVTSDGLVTIESAGDIVIRAAMAGDVNYEDVTAEIVITVNKLVQAELAITPVESKTYGDAPFQLSFTGGTAGGAVAYTVLSGPASVTANGLVTINGAGGIVISAKMAGGANYEDVTAQIIITVNRAAQEKPDTSRTFEDPSVISSGIPGISVEIDENGGISYKRDESKNLQYCMEECMDDANWFDDFDFASLPSNKEYAVYIRAKGTDDYHASEPQEIQFRTITEALSVKERDRSLPAGGFGIGDGGNRDRASENRYGIFVDRRVVFGKAVFTVVTPGKVNADIIVYDNLGNAVFRAQNVKSGKAVLWNLTNRSGRSVGNGTYLVSVFFRDANGKIHKYSEYVYVRR